jgi:PAS domain-containing protein
VEMNRGMEYCLREFPNLHQVISTINPGEFRRVSLEQSPDQCIAEALVYGWNFVDLEVSCRSSKNEFHIVTARRAQSFQELWEAHIRLRYMVESIQDGLVNFHLDVTTGSSTSSFFTERYLTLTGVNRDDLTKYGIMAVGNRCHPDDLSVSDVLAKHTLSRLGQHEWPLRIFVDGRYAWRSYYCHCRSVDGKNVIMTCRLRDYTTDASRIGLTDCPGVSLTDGGGFKPVPMTVGDQDSVSSYEDPGSDAASDSTHSGDPESSSNQIVNHLKVSLLRDLSQAINVNQQGNTDAVVHLYPPEIDGSSIADMIEFAAASDPALAFLLQVDYKISTGNISQELVCEIEKNQNRIDHLATSLVFLKIGLYGMKRKVNKSFLSSLVNRALNNCCEYDSDQGILLLTYWLSMEWGLFLGCKEVLISCLEEYDGKSTLAEKFKKVLINNTRIILLQ